MNRDELKLHKILINLTKGFTYQDFVEYRKNRNWAKYDTSTPIERLKIIINEVKEYKNGYFDDEFSENNNSDCPEDNFEDFY